MTGAKTFRTPLSVRSETVYANTINGIKVDDFVTVSDNFTIPKATYLNGLTVTEELTLVGDLFFGGINITKAMMVDATYNMSKDVLQKNISNMC